MAKINVKGDIVVNEYKEFYDWFGWDCTCPKDVNDILDSAEKDEIIDVYINSGGGHVMAGQEIYSALRRDNRVRIHIEGMACSAASIIAMAGQSDMSPAALVMIHNVSGGATGDYHDMEKAKNELKTMNEALANAYVEKTGMDRDKLLSLMDKETWLTANQCVELGFVDSIETASHEQSFAFNSVDSGVRLTSELMEKAKHEMATQKENEKLKRDLIEDLDDYGV